MEAGSNSLNTLLRHHLVNTLGWRSLRPLQEAAIPKVLAGEDALILAPTAGGKTEAAIFPTISRMLDEEWSGTSILYICPLKALLNNLAERLSSYFRMVGYESELWHGDINASKRRKILDSRPACLLTTPESLESMLISSKRERKQFLQDVRVVIIDEIHAFAGDDRGTHLLSVVERISEIAPHPIQRIGLSATVGNPDQLLKWLTCNNSERESSVITVSGKVKEAEVNLDFVGNLENAALVISRLFRGQKRLVFCDSRRRVEELTQHLDRLGVTAFASHSSLSIENRRDSEAAFEFGEDCVIVATSTLELGIDVGDLDRVIQIDAPYSVASFLQRIGRTGRRENSSRNCLFLATSSDTLLHAASLLALWEKGYVEPISAPAFPYHIVAQQILTLCLQKGRIAKRNWFEAIENVPGIASIRAQELGAIVQNMVDLEFICEDEAFYSIGPQAEEIFGFRHYMDLLSVFSSPPMFEVVEGNRSVGFLDWLSLITPKGRERKPVVLAGKSWDIQEVVWSKQQILVSRSQEKGSTRWQGAALGLSFQMAQEARTILLSEEQSDRWTSRAKSEIEVQRNELNDLAQMAGQFFISEEKGKLVLPTFFGSMLNNLFACAIGSKLAIEVSADDFTISCGATESRTQIENFLRTELREYLKNGLELEEELLNQLKFSECLPRKLVEKAVLGRIQSIDAALTAIG